MWWLQLDYRRERCLINILHCFLNFNWLSTNVYTTLLSPVHWWSLSRVLAYNEAAGKPTVNANVLLLVRLKHNRRQHDNKVDLAFAFMSHSFKIRYFSVSYSRFLNVGLIWNFSALTLIDYFACVDIYGNLRFIEKKSVSNSLNFNKRN